MADRYLVQYAQPIRVDAARVAPFPLLDVAPVEDSDELDIVFEFELDEPTSGPH